MLIVDILCSLSWYAVYYYVAMIMWTITSNLLRRNRSFTEKKSSTTLMIVFGSGGHTTEMLYMIENTDLSKFKKVWFVVAKTDENSRKKAELFLKDKVKTENIHWTHIIRSREVHQSFVSSTFMTFIAYINALIIIAKARPNLLLTNGPGTALPLVYAVFTFRILLLLRAKTIFIESYCRVKSISLTGKLVMKFVDKFIVQWPELKEMFSNKVEHIGKII